MIIDINSGYVAGWLLADRESVALAEKLLADTVAKQQVDRDELTIHTDNGSSMASKSVAFLLAELGVTKTRSRPHVSNDNPYNESHFGILKYRPDFPDRFGSIEDAPVFCQRFLAWYNTEHYHSGVAWHQTIDVHYGRGGTVRAIRADVLSAAYTRTLNGSSTSTPPCPLPVAAWINKPPDEQERAAHSMNPSI